jgi:hypothetical protein
MKILGYISLNLRHYSEKLRQRVEEARIRLFSRQTYLQMPVPSWDNTQIAALAGPSSIFSPLLALNSTAEADAERFLAGEFCLFGRLLDGEKIQWNKDYCSGHEYEHAVFSSYTIVENTGADIVVPWELSRMQYIPTLIQAYRSTGHRKYADRFIELLDNWEESNPYLFGVNWVCGLDIAIRALNIALGLIYFSDIDAAARQRANRLLWAHLVFLQKRDLYQPKRTVNNHQLVAALLHYGLLHLFEPDATKKWRQEAYQIIKREMGRQFHPDGGNFESAILYHQFVLESAFVALALVAGDAPQSTLADRALIPETMADRLLKATQFTASYVRTWAGVPHIGDSSDGRILLHRGYFTWTPEDPAYIGDWSRLTIGDRDPFSDRTGQPEALLFAKTGLGLYSTPRYGALFAAMPVTENAAGHNHLDKTSLILQIDGIPVLIDAGTCCYTSDTAKRYRYRQGKAHNVMLIAGHDQADLQPSAAFSTPRYDAVGIAQEPSEVGKCAFRMWHDGYRRLPGRGSVSRQVVCDHDGLVLHDAMDGQGEERIELVFNLHPDISVTRQGDRLALEHRERILCTIRPDNGWTSALETGCFSNRYGQEQTCIRLVFSRTMMLPFETETRIALAPEPLPADA